jgi:hypothetical protein
MNFQNFAVVLIVAAAVIYAGFLLMQKRRAFSIKHGCGDGCGCGGGSKKLTS